MEAAEQIFEGKYDNLDSEEMGASDSPNKESDDRPARMVASSIRHTLFTMSLIKGIQTPDEGDEDEELEEGDDDSGQFIWFPLSYSN